MFGGCLEDTFRIGSWVFIVVSIVFVRVGFGFYFVFMAGDVVFWLGWGWGFGCSGTVVCSYEKSFVFGG